MVFVASRNNVHNVKETGAKGPENIYSFIDVQLKSYHRCEFDPKVSRSPKVYK
jgi:hypothetical protein